jgi:hypothetical protein
MDVSEYVGDFAIVAEGYTDQIVLHAILDGFYEEADDLRVNYEQPPLDESGQHGGHAFGGWGLVLDYFKQKKFLAALQTNRYLVVHIDTDVAHDYKVPAQKGGRTLTPVEHIAEIRDYFIKLIDGAAPVERFLFAIAVDSIECWLLPLVFDKSQKAKRTKETGCLEAINNKRKKDNALPLSKADGNEKAPEVYQELSKPLKKKKGLREAALNPGFRSLVEQLEALKWSPSSS